MANGPKRMHDLKNRQRKPAGTERALEASIKRNQEWIDKLEKNLQKDIPAGAKESLRSAIRIRRESIKRDQNKLREIRKNV